MTLRALLPTRPPGRLLLGKALLVGVLAGCPGSPADDDDTIALDDDDTAPAEFDDCTGPAQAVAEAEPNDASAPQVIDAAGDVVITGSCSRSGNDGRQWTEDIDAFAIRYACGGRAEFTLSWDSGIDQDTDARVTAPAIDPNGFVWHGFTPSTTPGETGFGQAGGDLLVEVLCWQGPEDATWTFTIDWPRAADWVPPGDDDDAADDDDAGDDDDVVDDDDSAADDDDSAADDDDSAADDDDSAADDDDVAGGP